MPQGIAPLPAKRHKGQLGQRFIPHDFHQVGQRDPRWDLLALATRTVRRGFMHSPSARCSVIAASISLSRLAR